MMGYCPIDKTFSLHDFRMQQIDLIIHVTSRLELVPKLFSESFPMLPQILSSLSRQVRILNPTACP